MACPHQPTPGRTSTRMNSPPIIYYHPAVVDTPASTHSQLRILTRPSSMATMDRCSLRDILTNMEKVVHLRWAFATTRWWRLTHRRWKRMHMTRSLNTARTSTKTSTQHARCRTNRRGTPHRPTTTTSALWLRTTNTTRWSAIRTSHNPSLSKWSPALDRHTLRCLLFWIEILLFEIILALVS